MPSHSPDQPVTRQRRIGILCLSAIPDDPRVRRQGDLLTKAGWDVVAVGLPGALSSQPGWMCLAVGETDSLAIAQQSAAVTGVAAKPGSSKAALPQTNRAPSGMVRSMIHNLERQAYLRPVVKPLMRQVRRAVRAVDVIRVALDKRHAYVAYWRLNDQFREIFDLARSHKADIWLANDWTTLPIAQCLAAEQGVPYGYDTHELAVDEYAQSMVWRLTQRPIIASVESDGISGAAFATCVSDGIAERLLEVYGLSKRPTVIRNTPMYTQQPFRPTGDIIEVLYHGVVATGRGLEACIRSVALWRPEFRLTIRGPSSPAYFASLKAEVGAAGLSGRVLFDEPVPMTELVARAASFDVGLFALPDHSLQNVHVLPNKFFEYTMAGLALCVSDLPEMTRLLRHYDLGELIDAVSPEAIAGAINRLDRGKIDRFKRNSLNSARDLNWEAEGKRLVDECARNLQLN